MLCKHIAKHSRRATLSCGLCNSLAFTVSLWLIDKQQKNFAVFFHFLFIIHFVEKEGLEVYMLLQTDPTMQGSPRSDSGGGTLLISSKEREFVVSSPMDRRSRSGSTSSRGSTSSGNKSSRRMLYEKQVGRVEGGLAAGKKSLKTDKKKRDHGGSSWSLGSHYSGDSSTTAADLEVGCFLP